ncbi:hypothetical protein O6H91_11G072200 [Diphasiastrum complanatum]|uniref:Uncharacterized protein n=1 Tax=Diphasiastrum complanatum TaxID=34168 RepID=A0ACC2CAN5_DIPCM|nr:hypothetical protein O6H91_11G072200 [Diphasiastrum complanatum]
MIAAARRGSGVVTRIEEFARRFLVAFSSGGDRLDEVGDRNVDIFDRSLKRKHRDRAAWLKGTRDPLLDLVTENLLDRLDDCTHKFPVALNLGGAVDHVKRSIRGRGGIERLITMDMSKDMIKKTLESSSLDGYDKFNKNIESLHVIGDEEFLPFKSGSLDLIISCLGLHWVNDLPGAMTQCRMALKPDGLFLASMYGGDTLRELRIACTAAQLEREGGVSPRISPLAQVRDAGNLLTRAGLALPTVDVDEYTVNYPSAFELIEHLRCMGDTNAVLQRNQIMRRDTALAAAAIYESMFGGTDGTVPATFQIIFMAGWSPHESQQKPKRRGSATASFTDIQKAFGGVDESGRPEH